MLFIYLFLEESDFLIENEIRIDTYTENITHIVFSVQLYCYCFLKFYISCNFSSILLNIVEFRLLFFILDLKYRNDEFEFKLLLFFLGKYTFVPSKGNKDYKKLVEGLELKLYNENE